MVKTNGSTPTFELDIFAPETLEVQIVYNGQVFDAELIPLTIHEWNAAMNAIPLPEVPHVIVKGKRVPNEDDEDYKTARDEAISLRMIYTVVKALQKGGNLQNLTSLPAAEQARLFGEAVDYGLFNDLYGALLSHRNRHEAQLTAKAATFRPVPEDHRPNRAAPKSEVVPAE